MKLGYARVSTEDQNLDGQRQRLSVAGCEKLFEEKLSGAKRNRPNPSYSAHAGDSLAGVA